MRLAAAEAEAVADSAASATPHDIRLAQSALALHARMLSAASLRSAAHAVTAAIAGDFGFDRASLGLRRHGRTQILASSDLAPASPQGELPQRLLGAMDEAMEQGASIAAPSSRDTDGVSTWIRLEHDALQRLVGGSVATVPLGVDGELVGAVCVERHAGPPIGAGELLRLERLLVLAVPALQWMDRATQPWHRRAWRELVQGWAALRQPERRARRRTLAAAAVALVFAGVAPLEHAVGGRARVEGAEQRVMVAPAEGFVKAAHVRPGDRVKAGAALVDLLEGDLRLEHDRWTSQLAQHENAYAAAMSKADRAAASTSIARIGEAQAQLALVDAQLARGRITAPFDALVIQGDLSQSIGAPVRQGDALVTLASTDRFRVIVEVDEVDIARLQPGQTGRLALSSLPWHRHDITVERIAPLSRAVEGRNVFDVEARLASPQGDLRPGLLGRAEIVVGRMPPLWAWTGHALDRVRIALWSWLG